MRSARAASTTSPVIDSPPRHRRTDHLGETGGHPAAGQDPDPCMGVGEDGPLGSDQEVAPQRQLQAAGERGAVDRSDDRRAHLGDGG